MAFLDNLGSNLRNVGKSIYNADKTKAKMEIGRLNKMMESEYSELGRVYYQFAVGKLTAMPDTGDSVRHITEILYQLEKQEMILSRIEQEEADRRAEGQARKEKIREEKEAARMYAHSQDVQQYGGTRQEQAYGVMSQTQAYTGASQPDNLNADASTAAFCTSCGAALEPDGLFCVMCGAPVAQIQKSVTNEEVCESDAAGEKFIEVQKSEQDSVEQELNASEDTE